MGTEHSCAKAASTLQHFSAVTADGASPKPPPPAQPRTKLLSKMSVTDLQLSVNPELSLDKPNPLAEDNAQTAIARSPRPVRQGGLLEAKNDNSPGYEAHLFICTKSKPSGECCASKESERLVLKLKEWAHARWGNSVRINASGCLGYCARGITAVLYPSNQWVTHLTANDLPKLQELLENQMARNGSGPDLSSSC